MLDYTMSNNDYHGEKHHYSSSQLKDILKSPELFYQKHILGRKDVLDSPALRVGNAVHGRILEPEKYGNEFALFKGKMRKGKEWEKFQEENKNKIILSEIEELKVDLAVSNVFNTDSTFPYINGGKAEVSLFSELNGIKVKVRADYLNETMKYIQDVKTTSELVNVANIQKVIAAFSYDLSASLYLDVFAKEGIHLDSFIWVFTSTVYKSCRVFKASEQMIENGRIKYKKALELIKYYESINWDFGVTEISPVDYDVQGISQINTIKEGW